MENFFSLCHSAGKSVSPFLKSRRNCDVSEGNPPFESGLSASVPAKRNSAVRNMSESLLNYICIRIAEEINHTLVPNMEPIVRDEMHLVLPKLESQLSGKSPHFELLDRVNSGLRSKLNLRLERRCLFPIESSSDTNAHGPLATFKCLDAPAIDLTEPVFDDYIKTNLRVTSENDGVKEHNFIQVQEIERKSSDSFRAKSCFHDKPDCENYSHHNLVYEEFANFDECKSEILCSVLKREPAQCPLSAFEFFCSKIRPLIRVEEYQIEEIVKKCWDDLPVAQKYAFEMQYFALKDCYKNQILFFVQTLNDTEKEVYRQHRQKFHAHFFGERFIDNKTMFSQSEYWRPECDMHSVKFANTFPIDAHFKKIVASHWPSESSVSEKSNMMNDDLSSLSEDKMTSGISSDINSCISSEFSGEFDDLDEFFAHQMGNMKISSCFQMDDSSDSDSSRASTVNSVILKTSPQ